MYYFLLLHKHDKSHYDKLTAIYPNFEIKAFHIQKIILRNVLKIINRLFGKYLHGIIRMFQI